MSRVFSLPLPLYYLPYPFVPRGFFAAHDLAAFVGFDLVNFAEAFRVEKNAFRGIFLRLRRETEHVIFNMLRAESFDEFISRKL